MASKDRVVADCRLAEGDCTLTVAGTEEEVVPVAAWHMVHAHGEKDTPALREEIREMLVPERREPITEHTVF